jgi:heptosyltransferase-2
MAGAQAVHEASRVLVLRADDLGDNVMASGFLPALAGSIKGECGFIGPPAAIELMDLSGLAFVAGVDCRPRRHRDVFTAGRRVRDEINRFDPDVVLLPRFDFEREALAVGLLGIHRRTTITWARDATPKRQRRDWWLDALPGARLPVTGVPTHEFGRLQHFARFVGVSHGSLEPALVVDPVAVPEIAEVGGPLIGVAVGAAQARRQWPVDRYAAVIEALSLSGSTAVLLGSPDEARLGREMVAQLGGVAPVVDLIGRISLRQVAAVVSRCELFIGNDSGLGHVAAAVGTPTVVISCHPVGAPADHVNAPERYQPIGGRSIVVQPALPRTADCSRGCIPADEPCCITQVSVEEVLDACRTLMVAPGSASGDHGS